MKLAIVILALSLVCVAEAGEQQAWLVFRGPREIKALKVNQKTYVEFPMVNGKPDWKQGHIIGAVVEFDRNLGHIEIRKSEK